MKVRPQEELSWHKSKLKQLKKERQHQIDEQEKQTKQIRENFKEKKVQVKIQGEEDLHVAVTNNRKEIDKAMAGKKEKLEKFRTENIKHQKVLEDQRLDLDKYNDLRTTDMNSQYEEKYNTLFQEGSEKVQAFEEDINRRIANINADSNQEINHYRADMNLKLEDSAHEFGSRIKDKEDVHKAALRRNDVKHAAETGRKRLEHRDKTSKLLTSQNHETESRTVLHSEKLKTMDDHHTEQMKSKQKAFEAKTKRMDQEHLTVLELMKERFAQRLNALKDGFSKKKVMIEDRNSDSFYNVGKISPTLQEKVDSYILSMKVPEHERENITVSPRNRNIKITYHRNHSARVEEQDGSTHTSKRTELMTKQIPTSEILNNKGVTQKYENGVLQFKILKA